jgi:transcriptional regulator with XRE-family HTH domain
MQNDIVDLISKNIQIMIKRMSMSQNDLADTSGLNRTTINQIVARKKICNIETLEKIANAFEVETAFLLNRNLDTIVLTGIKSIDTAIAEINNNLYKGPRAKKIIGKYFADNYQIKYAEKQIGDPDRFGPNLDQELKINTTDEKGNRNRANVVRSAWITGDQVHTLLEVRQNAKFGQNSVANALRADTRFEVTTLIDTWLMDYRVDEIRFEGAPVKINRRLLKYLDQKAE